MIGDDVDEIYYFDPYIDNGGNFTLSIRRSEKYSPILMINRVTNIVTINITELEELGFEVMSR